MHPFPVSAFKRWGEWFACCERTSEDLPSGRSGFLPPIANQLLSVLELNGKIGDRSFLQGNSAFDFANRKRTFPRIYLAMNR